MGKSLTTPAITLATKLLNQWWNRSVTILINLCLMNPYLINLRLNKLCLNKLAPNKPSFSIIGLILLIPTPINSGTLAAHQDGTALAHALNQQITAGGFLTSAQGQDKIWGYTDSPPEAALKPENLTGIQNQNSEASLRIKDQLSGPRMHINPLTDPMFVNANRALANPTETLNKQTITTTDLDNALTRPCTETRDEEFEVINYAEATAYYKRFEVSQFYNHCPNHSGWGKSIAQGCITWQDRELLKATRNPSVDYEETVQYWTTDAHPDFENLFRLGKCRLVKEMPKEEGRESRMIPVTYYAKVEVIDNSDWHISVIEDHRPGRHRLKGPEDFGWESFSKIQVYSCSYTSPGNTCKPLRLQGAIDKTSLCSEKMAGVCVKWDKTVQIPRPGSSNTQTKDLSHDPIELLNMKGELNDTSYAENQEAADAIAKLTAIHDIGAALPKFDTGDPNALTVFRGADHRCVSQGGNNRCPGGNGRKEAGDQALERKVNEGRCIRVGAYEPDTRNIGILVGQKRTMTTYCCYDTTLSKVLHQGAVDQGIESLGDPKTAQCGALSLAQLQAMQWDRVDFTPFVNEVTSKASLNVADVGKRSSETVRAHLDNQLKSPQHSARMKAMGQ